MEPIYNLRPIQLTDANRFHLKYKMGHIQVMTVKGMGQNHESAANNLGETACRYNKY